MGVMDNYILFSLVSKKPAQIFEDGRNGRTGGNLMQESGWLEEPGGKQGLGEGLLIRQSWPGHGSGVKPQAWHRGVSNHQDIIPEK